MKKKSISVNAVLNIVKSLLSVVFPLIMYPYASRILGVENIGKVNYGSSIVSYFSLIAAFGITSYAIREGSKIRDDRKKFTILANELFTVNLMFTVASYVFLIACLLFVPNFSDYTWLILLQSFTILFTTLGVDWINTIYEDYFYTTVRGIITHVLSLVLLFIIVKNRNDYYQYAFLTVLSNAVVCLLNFFYCRRYAHMRITTHPHMKKHVKKMSVFFANSVAVSIYVSADTTMLGWIVGDYAVGIYSTAVKIYNIVKLLLVAVYSVALARLSFYFASGKHEEYKKLFSKISSVILLLLLPMATGIFMYSKEIIYLIAGHEFADAIVTLKILAIASIFAILGGLLTQCLNVSIGKERTNAVATIISAFANVALNIPFIFLLKENGAAITTAISEAIVFLFCLIKSRNYIKKYLDRSVLINGIQSFIGTIVVVLVYKIVINLNLSFWMSLIIGFSATCIIYLIVLLLLKNEIIAGQIDKILLKVKRR